ncbi:hypothetical protein DMX03_24895 [Pseudomonas koreensis]|nr:hypothetical protein DMX03_24895 [Pseudomonas koreensis]
MIVPTLCVGMQPGTLRVPLKPNAERPLRHSHAERGNDLARQAGQCRSNTGASTGCRSILCSHA